MNRSRHSKLALVLLLTAAIALAVGTTGFSSVVADRPVSITVVSDQNAYVGFNTTDRTVSGTDSDTIQLVTVTNRLSDPIAIQDISVEVSDSDSGIDLREPKVPDERSSSGSTDEILPGESVMTTAPVESCPVGNSSVVEVSIETNSTGVQAIFNDETDSAEFVVTCPSIEDVEFDGNGTNGGNAEIEPDGLTVGITLHLSNDKTTGCEVDTSEKIRPQCLSNKENSPQIKTVVINATDEEYSRNE